MQTYFLLSQGIQHHLCSNEHDLVKKNIFLSVTISLCIYTKAFQCHQKLEDQCGCGTLLIYLPKANVTSIWHLAGGNTGPGWQEMNAALHHNEFMAHGQVALCMCKWNHNEKNPLFAHFLLHT